MHPHSKQPVQKGQEKKKIHWML